MGDPYRAGVVGNGETAAVVAEDAAVTWLCPPRFDGPPLLAAGLDPRRGGCWRLRVDGEAPRPAGQEYLPDTNVLRTRGRAGEVEVAVTDWMPWGQPVLVREVVLGNPGPRDAACRLDAALEPVASRWLPWRRAGVRDGFELLALPSGAPALDGACFLPRGYGDGVYAAWGPVSPEEATVPAGGQLRRRLALAYGPSAEAALRAARAGLSARLDEAVRFWQEWLAGARDPAVPDPAWRALYRRSLLVLKLLQHRDGAFVAAATASWPAIPGGGDNWDYRFCWLRDGCFTALALDLAGLHREARDFYRFVLGLLGPDGEWRSPLWTVDGRVPGEVEVDDLAGPGGERPVRLGNAAAVQLQLDSAGHVLHGLWLHGELTGDPAFLRECWPAVRRAAGWVVRHWREPEHGLWEIRAYLTHWLHGKVMCWVALDRAARLAARVGADEDARRYAAEADAVARYALERGWDPERRAFVHSCDPDSPRGRHLDVAVLAVGEYGLLPPDDPRLEATVAALDRPGPEGLLRQGGLARLPWEPHPFVLATFWLARAHARAGRARRARALVEQACRCANGLGLMAEQFDPSAGRPAGNFPQAFSHEEFVRTVWELAAVPGPDRPARQEPAPAGAKPQAD